MNRIYLSTVLLAFAAASHAGHHEKSDAAPAMSMEEQKMMEAMQAAATPGNPHAKLAEQAGSYDAKMMFWSAPGTDPMEAAMTVERSMDLDGRILVEHWEGSVMGAPFKGIGRTGYDNVTKRYWSTWTDNMSTGVLVMYGNYSEDGKSVEFTGESTHMISGQTYALRSVGTFPSSGSEEMAMYEDHGQGEFKSMAFTLTRR